MFCTLDVLMEKLGGRVKMKTSLYIVLSVVLALSATILFSIGGWFLVVVGVFVYPIVGLGMSVVGGKADFDFGRLEVCFSPKTDGRHLGFLPERCSRKA